MESGCPEVLGERLLSLLLEEPAPAEFARRLDEIEKQAGDAQPARRQVQIARDVRTLLDRYRRRAGELAVFYDTAGDLPSLRDPETVLQSIVRRGRRLLGTDMAYLMRINEERGITVLLVEQNLQFATTIADHAHLLDKGRIVRELPARDVLTDRDLQHGYLASDVRAAPVPPHTTQEEPSRWTPPDRWTRTASPPSPAPRTCPSRPTGWR